MARLDEQRAQQQQQVGDIDVRAHAVGEDGYAREQDGCSQHAGGGPEPVAAKPVAGPAARRQREEAERDRDVLHATRAERREH